MKMGYEDRILFVGNDACVTVHARLGQVSEDGLRVRRTTPIPDEEANMDKIIYAKPFKTDEVGTVRERVEEKPVLLLLLATASIITAPAACQCPCRQAGPLAASACRA